MAQESKYAYDEDSVKAIVHWALTAQLPMQIELRECAMILHKVEDAELRELYKKRDELHPENHLSNGDSLCQESERLSLLFAVSLSLLSLILACLVLSYH